MDAPHLLQERYVVADGNVTLRVLIGYAQRGVSTATLDGSQLATGTIDGLRLGLGPTLVGKRLSVVTSVTKVQHTTNETSVQYVLSGGVEERHYDLTATVEHEGDTVTYVAEFDLVAKDSADTNKEAASVLDQVSVVESATVASKRDGDLVPLSSVTRLVRHPPVESILNKAAAAASSSAPGTPVSTSFLLLAIVDEGTARPDPQWAADFLTNKVLQAGQRAKEARDRYLARKAAGSPRKGGRLKDLHATKYLLEDVERAATIARDTTGRDLVATRHLLASLLIERSGVEPSGAQTRLMEMGLEPARLRQEMLEFVVGWATTIPRGSGGSRPPRPRSRGFCPSAPTRWGTRI